MTLDDYAKLPKETLMLLEHLASCDHLSPEEQAFLDKHMPDQVNPCGECTLCCIAPTIEPRHVEPPLTGPKPAGQACEHCDAKGCTVYEKRPSICKGYLCLYALGIAPDRPDSTGICWTFQPADDQSASAEFVATGHSLDYDVAIQDTRNQQAIKMLLSMGVLGVNIRDPKQVVQFAVVGRDGQVACRHVQIDPNDPLHHNWLPETERVSIT
jgi:hypothetical protein